MKWWSTQAARLAMARNSILYIAAIGLICLGLIAYARADTIVRGFKSEGSLQPGLIVALTKDKSDTIEAAPANDPGRIYGVVIDPSQAPVTIQQKDQQVFVSTGGNYPVLVDTRNGGIATGDYISISLINGIGTKASQLQSTVLGKALEAFDGKSKVITTDSEGVAIGRIAVNITPSKNPLTKKDVSIPAPLKRFGQAVAGKNVSAPRIYAALAVFIVSALIAISVLWIGIRGGMVAIGRNPLSHKSITRSLLQVVVVAILVFIIGVFGVYLLLRL